MYTAIVEALDATGAGVVAVGVLDLGSMMVVMAQPLRRIVGLAARRANNVVRGIAVRRGAHDLSIGGGPLSGRSRRQPARTVLSADRFHPDGIGYGIWAGPVAPHLLRLVDANETSS